MIGGNMMGQTVIELAEEFAVVRRARPEVRMPVWHFSLSLQTGEYLDDEKWNLLAKDYLRLMGYSLVNHQYFVVRHTDQFYEHVHGVCNRIGFNLKIVANSWDRLRTKEVCQQLEKAYGLKPVLRRERGRFLERGAMTAI